MAHNVHAILVEAVGAKREQSSLGVDLAAREKQVETTLRVPEFTPSPVGPVEVAAIDYAVDAQDVLVDLVAELGGETQQRGSRGLLEEENAALWTGGVYLRIAGRRSAHGGVDG